MELSTRQERIVERLKHDGSVEVDALARELCVTTQTIRRDLAFLCSNGLASRTHGGARRLISSVSLGYEERRLENSAGKKAIGTLAAGLIPNGSSVILNIGTTTEQVASALSLHRDLTVISNNINVIHILRHSRAKALVLIGGTVRPSDGAIVGDDAVEHISRFKADFAVIGASALDEDGAALDFDPREVAVARAILKNARTRIMVADVSKFERTASIRICNVEGLNFVVMDKPPPRAFRQVLADAGTALILPEPHASQTEAGSAA